MGILNDELNRIHHEMAKIADKYFGEGEKMADKLISADALRQRMYHDAFETDTEMQRWDSGCWIRYKMFENALEAAPTVDAVPVVRCKDCKHSFGELATRGGIWSTDDKHLFCQMTKHLMRVDDFCSWGERREDDRTV